ncbi:MAG: helicase associated domain-containing protein [Prevotella sp.]|nr:helicase associated domain-containing protein [Prevotella sp.]
MVTQDERWQERYKEVVAFIEREHRNPSRYNAEERGLYCNWLKHNRKLYKAGELKAERVPLFEELLNLSEQYRRKNQYE